jgi:hypothetical protein
VATLKLKTWYKEETTVYGHLLLPFIRNYIEKIRDLTNCVIELYEYTRYSMPDEYNWDELFSVLKEFGLKYVEHIESPVSERGLVEAVGGKEGSACFAASRAGDLYAFFVTSDYTEFYIFQFTRNDVYLMKVYEKLGEQESKMNLTRDIAREELGMLNIVQELVKALQSAPVTPSLERVRTTSIVELLKRSREQLEKATALPISILKQAGRAANIVFKEREDKRLEAYLVLGKHGMYVVAFTVPLWQEGEGGWKVDVLLRRVDPRTAWKCIKKREDCQLLRELF